MKIVNDDGTFSDRSAADSEQFFANPELIHYVGMLNPPRPGFGSCIETLEFTHYKPGTPRNELFTMHILTWQDIVWAIISIPIAERDYMDKAAHANGLRVANGVPTIMSSEGVRSFVISNERVFTLENVPGHPVYQQR